MPSHLNSHLLQEPEEPLAKVARLNDSMEDGSPMDQLVSALRQLLIIFEDGIHEGYITQQTYFAFYLIKGLVEVKIPTANALLAAIPPALITDLLRTLPELFTYPILLHLHDVRSTHGRNNMAKDLCVLRNYHLRNVSQESSNV